VIGEVWRLPNLLSLSRVVLTPVIAADILADRYERALTLLFVAGVTDLFDGILARRLRQESRFGAYADPVADKILMSAVFLSLGFARAAPAWLIALILGRDAAILGVAAIVVRRTGKRSFPPSFWGKLSTFVQIGTALVLMAERAGQLERALPLTEWAIQLCAVTTAWSGVHYAWRAWRTL